jgi:hypothetical protein
MQRVMVGQRVAVGDYTLSIYSLDVVRCYACDFTLAKGSYAHPHPLASKKKRRNTCAVVFN